MENDIVELIKRKRKSYVLLRPNFGSYRRNPYVCDTAEGRNHWWNHLMESKFWFKENLELQDKFNKIWDKYERKEVVWK